MAPAVLAIDYFYYGRKASPRVTASVLVVCLGVGLATVTDPQISSNLAGLAAGFGSVAATALYQIWAGSKQKELGLGSMQLLHQYVPLAAGLLAALVPLCEPMGWAGAPPGSLLGYQYTPGAVAAIAISSVLGLLVNLSTFLVSLGGLFGAGPAPSALCTRLHGLSWQVGHVTPLPRRWHPGSKPALPSAPHPRPRTWTAYQASGCVLRHSAARCACSRRIFICLRTRRVGPLPRRSMAQWGAPPTPCRQVIGATSSLTYNVVGHVKTVLILSGGVAFFGDTMPPKKAAGILAAMGGIIWCAAPPPA